MIDVQIVNPAAVDALRQVFEADVVSKQLELDVDRRRAAGAFVADYGYTLDSEELPGGAEVFWLRRRGSEQIKATTVTFVACDVADGLLAACCLVLDEAATVFFADADGSRRFIPPKAFSRLQINGTFASMYRSYCTLRMFAVEQAYSISPDDRTLLEKVLSRVDLRKPLFGHAPDFQFLIAALRAQRLVLSLREQRLLPGLTTSSSDACRDTAIAMLAATNEAAKAGEAWLRHFHGNQSEMDNNTAMIVSVALTVLGHLFDRLPAILCRLASLQDAVEEYATCLHDFGSAFDPLGYSSSRGGAAA